MPKNFFSRKLLFFSQIPLVRALNVEVQAQCNTQVHPHLATPNVVDMNSAIGSLGRLGFQI